MQPKDIIDKSQLKSAIKEILTEDPSLFKSVVREILMDHQVIVSEVQAERRAKLEKMIDEDFDQYDDVFKSLA